MPPRRSIALGATSVVAAFALTLALAACDPLPGGGVVSTVGEVDFASPLRIPPLAESTTDDAGTRHFSLTAQAGSTEFTAGVATTTWGYDGDFLGPTLVADAGEKVQVDIANDLDEETTVHWHGMHLPAAADGGPHSPIAPGASSSPAWRIDQSAATLWYHPHITGNTEHQASMGLDGLFIVRDAAEAALPLPRRYGVDDIPLVVQDVRFGDDGQFDTGVKGYIGTLGDQVLVNGSLGAHFDVTTTVVRVRLLNGSPARVYDFGFDDGRRFDQIASDGGLLEAPVATTGLVLSPGERAEILVTLAPGESTVLRSTPPDLGMNPTTGERNGASDSFDLLELRAADTLATVGTLPAALVPVERLDPADAAKTRSFVLSDARINNELMDMGRVDVVALLGDTEVWVVDNSMAQPHSFHVHGLQLQVLDIDGVAPPRGLAGWKDTVYVPPGSQYRLIMRFDDYADPRTPYMFHCHLLQHEDDGMMGQFVVVEPGDEEYAGVSAAPAGGHTAHGG